MRLESLVLLWTLTGGAIATAVMIRVWGLDPPSNVLGRFIGILIAGFLGGAVGGALVHSLDVAGSNPMPGIVGAIAVGLIFSGGLTVLGGAGTKVAR